MRKLTVKNFSVIKEAELEFGKITVLIGPQSSGKSLLCRLSFFFQQVVSEQAEEGIKASEQFEQLQERLNSAFALWFGFDPTATQTSQVTYSAGSYNVSLTLTRQGQPGSPRIQWDFSNEFEESYREVWGKLNSEKLRRESVPNPKFFAEDIREQLAKLRGQYSPEIYSYIPSTRAFFLSIHQAIFGTAGRRDDIQLRFSQDFSYGFESRVPRTGLKHPLTHWIDAESERILKGKVISAGSDFHFASNDGRILTLPQLSSGTQELLPLLTCLREYVAASAAVAKTLDLPKALHRRLFFLEEPESNVFPSTQYDLVRIFARMAIEPVLDAYWVITTHSPYILSVFGDLVKAGLVGSREPERRAAVEQVIPKQYWIEPADFAGYKIEDGKLQSIFDEKSGQIDGDYLDDVSGKISDEFGQLLEIQYGK